MNAVQPAQTAEQPPQPWEETALYRHFDAAGRLLYVGISLSVVARTARHMMYAHWSRQVATISIERHPTRDKALAAEAAAIVAEHPLHNIAGKPAPIAPDIDDAAEMEKLERYLAASREGLPA